jgi:hypothetical protein
MKEGADIARLVYRLGYRLEGRGTILRFPAEGRDVSLRDVQTGSGAHSTSYEVGTGGSFPRVKLSERETDLTFI